MIVCIRCLPIVQMARARSASRTQTLAVVMVLNASMVNVEHRRHAPMASSTKARQASIVADSVVSALMGLRVEPTMNVILVNVTKALVDTLLIFVV